MNTVAVIGAGYWGKNLVKTFYELGCLGAVAEPDKALRSNILNSYPGVTVYDDYIYALQDEVKAFVIATPAHTHYQIARDAILAGKDVFVEKPMVLNSGDAEQLVKLATTHSRILMVGHLLLYQPAVNKIKSLIDCGEIGKIHSIHQERMKLGRVRSVENVLWSFGVHDIAVLLYLVGENPRDINIVGHSVIQNGIEDDVYIHLHFDGNVQGHIRVSWLWPETRRRLTVVGSEGMVIYDGVDETMLLHKKGIRRDLSSWDEGSCILHEIEDYPLTIECQHFLDCIRDRVKPISDGKNGMDVVRILESASTKLESSGWVPYETK